MSISPRHRCHGSIEIETCPECGGRLRVIACVEDPPLIAEILGPVRRREALFDGTPGAPPGSGHFDQQCLPESGNSRFLVPIRGHSLLVLHPTMGGRHAPIRQLVADPVSAPVT